MRRRAHCRVVTVRAEHLPRRPILEANKHLLLIGVGAQLVREGLVDAPLARVGVNRGPDRLATLAIRWEHVPKGRRMIDHACGGPVKTKRGTGLAGTRRRKGRRHEQRTVGLKQARGLWTPRTCPRTDNG